MPAGGEDIGEQNEIVFEFVAGLAGQLQAVKVREGDAQHFRLASAIRAHAGIAVAGGGSFGVGGETGVGETASAVQTESAGNIEGHDHAVARPDRDHAFADFFDHAHVFVTKDNAGFRAAAVVIHVQIAAADGGGSDANDRVAHGFNPWVGYFFDGNLVLSLEDDCFHDKYDSFFPIKCGNHCR